MSLCPVTGCGQPAGTACTMQDCPGRKVSRASSRRAGVATLSGDPTYFALDQISHAHLHSEVSA